MTMRRGAVWFGLFMLLAATTPIFAQKRGPSWGPETDPGKFDWVRMDTGEWFGGELLALYDDVLEFDSEKLGYQSFEWEDVVEVRTARVMEIWLLGGISARGKLVIEGKKVRVLGEPEVQFDREDLLTIAAGDPTESSRWSANLTLGGNFRRGNTDSTEYNFRADVKRRTARSRLLFDALSNFNSTNDERTADNHRLQATWDLFVNERLFFRPTFAEYYRDIFQNIAHRVTLGAGMGYTLADTPRTAWDVIGGPAVQWTWFDTVEADEDDVATTPALVLSTTLETEVTKWMDFDFNYAFQLTNDEAGRYNHHALVSFDTELTSKLDFTVSFVWDRIAEPRPDETGEVPQKDDFRLAIGLTLEL